MTTDDPDRPVHESRAEGDRRQQQGQQQDGQISEMAQTTFETGGADATDKSTGTAADRADQPGE
jgi:hypothetical protein